MIGRVQIHAEPVAAGVGSRDRIADQLLTPSRVADMLRGLMERQTKRDTPFRRAWLRSVIDGVEVDDTEIRIHGRRTVLERLVMGGGRLRQECPVLFANGAPNRIRTCGLHLRRVALYPAELWVHRYSDSVRDQAGSIPKLGNGCG